MSRWKQMKAAMVWVLLLALSQQVLAAEQGMSGLKKGLIAFYVVVGLAAVVVVVYCIKKRKENR